MICNDFSFFIFLNILPNKCYSVAVILWDSLYIAPTISLNFCRKQTKGLHRKHETRVQCPVEVGKFSIQNNVQHSTVQNFVVVSQKTVQILPSYAASMNLKTMCKMWQLYMRLLISFLTDPDPRRLECGAV